MKSTVKSRDELIIRPSMSLYFGGGEIWFEQLDALYDYTDIVIDKFKEDIHVFSRPSTPSVIAVNLKETLVTDELAELMANAFTQAGASVTRVAFVGLDKGGRALVKQRINSCDAHFAYKFIDDFEKAKEWLAGEKIS